MNFFGRLFGDAGDRASAPPSMPWDRKPSIFDHVCSHVAHDQPGLTEGGGRLPDEDRISASSKLRWSGGALEGVMLHGMGLRKSEKSAKRAVQLVLVYCRQPTVTNKARLYQFIVDETALSMLDTVLENLVDNEGINHERLHELAHSFVTLSRFNVKRNFRFVALAGKKGLLLV